jgi:oligopeptide/dipeptide ABC transporter ATP-binding protein
MRQRLMLAMALMCQPALLIADEPTTALDVTIQAQILELLDRLRTELGMALLLITHDLGVVAGITDRVVVMYAGRAIEEASTEELLEAPRHPYTRGLLASVARLDRPRGLPLQPIDGMPPDLSGPVAGCAFSPRCSRAADRCAAQPPSVTVSPGHRGACWALADEALRLHSSGPTLTGGVEGAPAPADDPVESRWTP